MLPPNKYFFVAVAIAHVSFLIQLHTLYTQFMLIFILIDIFSFSKDYVGQNYSFSGSPTDKFPYPWHDLKNSFYLTTWHHMHMINFGKHTSHW